MSMGMAIAFVTVALAWGYVMGWNDGRGKRS